MKPRKFRGPTLEAGQRAKELLMKEKGSKDQDPDLTFILNKLHKASHP